MRCGRNLPIVFVGVVFGYFWLSIVGSVICGFIFFMISRISTIIPMINNNVAKKISYVGIPLIESYIFILFIPFFGIVFSEVEYFFGDYGSDYYFQKVFRHILFGDIQQAFSYILLSPSDKENPKILDKLWLFHSYNYFFVAFPFLLLSQSFRYRNSPMKREKKGKRIKEILQSLLLYIIYMVCLGVEINKSINGCEKCGPARKYITVHLLGEIWTGVPIMIFSIMPPVAFLCYAFISVRALMNNR